ncbi:MAG: HAMP domain-containing histidine kinase, partial [Myxococcales bacterium]|nr:HAMP domain-containing histidine kinase [Myxococcales bacterium]
MHLLTELQSLAESREDFMALLGHELRNPLNAIAGASQVLERKVDGGPIGEVVDMLGRQTAFMRRLVDDLLDVARLERGKLVLELEPVDAAVLVREVVDDFRVAANDREVVLDAEIPAGAVPVRADRTRLAQMIANLLDNAAKFGEGHPIQLTVRQRDQEVAICVRDQG